MALGQAAASAGRIQREVIMPEGHVGWECSACGRIISKSANNPWRHVDDETELCEYAVAEWRMPVNDGSFRSSGDRYFGSEGQGR